MVAQARRLVQFARLPEYVHGIPRTGRMNSTIEEGWIETKMNQHNNLQSKATYQVYKKMFKREFDRVYGKARIHAAINFTGYGRFWAALLGCAKKERLNMKSIYQHNNKYGEWSMKFPTLESVFSLYRHYNNVVSASELTRNLNKQSPFICLVEGLTLSCCSSVPITLCFPRITKVNLWCSLKL